MGTQTSTDSLEERLARLEREAAALRRAVAALARQVADREVDELIDELSDRPMSETEMEAAFERLDAALDSPR